MSKDVIIGLIIGTFICVALGLFIDGFAFLAVLSFVSYIVVKAYSEYKDESTSKFWGECVAAWGIIGTASVVILSFF